MAAPRDQTPTAPSIPEDPHITPQPIVEEMERSYLEYAMSVIVARALPDVRDGLKPVHRRILWAMWDMGLRAGGKSRKSATVVGEVLGKYHPHGDTAVYDSLVRMAQDFSLRYPLIDGQGNFGSIDGDNPAAMRYTEVRMRPIAQELLLDIEKETVEWGNNYDATRKEPLVLPSKIPNLLINGTVGIAVGMATNIPPHNLTEVIDGLIHLLDHPEADVEELNKFVKGPDFPTGGLIYNIQDIQAAYGTGKGRIMMQAVAQIEEGKKGDYQIVIKQLPYQVNKADLVIRIAELVKTKKIQGVVDLRDESDRKEGVRIVVYLKGSAYPKKVLNALYDLTPMTTAFHVNMVTLLDGIQPRLLTLKSILEEHLLHRAAVLTRRATYDLKVARERAHILEGLTKALDQIDAVIALIKRSENREAASLGLQKKFSLTQLQAQAILDMRLASLAALERSKIKAEYEALLKTIAALEALLADKEKIKDAIKEELRTVKKTYGDERRTKIVSHPLKGFTAEDLIPSEDVVITLSKSGYIKRQLANLYRAQIRGGIGVTAATTKEEDQLSDVVATNTHDDIWFFTDRGRIFAAKVYDIPAALRQAKGQAIQNIIQLAPDERVTAMITTKPADSMPDQYLVFATKQGVIKKTSLSLFKNIRKSGIISIALRGNDQLLWVRINRPGDQIFEVTAGGQAILFDESQIRPMGRSAAGVRAIRLRGGDEVVGMNVIGVEQWQAKPDVVVILENGIGKRTAVSNFRNQHRGGVGMRVVRVTPRTGKNIGMMITAGEPGDVMLLTRHGTMIRVPLRSVKRLGRDTQGVILMRPKQGDRVVSAALIKQEVQIPETPTGRAN